jgi:formylmethanofuran dehydrogenase subunit E
LIRENVEHEMAQQLFERILVVSLKGNNNNSPNDAAITYRFPPGSTNAKDDAAVIEFCWPESRELLNKLIKSATSAFASKQQQLASRQQTFSFVLTDSNGGKQFGYCRRLLTLSPPECFVLLGLNPSFSLFSQVLDVVEQRRAISSAEVFLFLKAVLSHDFPAPGQSLKLRVLSSVAGQPEAIELNRPADEELLLDYVSFEPLFRSASPHQVVDLFCAVMRESHIVLTSHSIAVLTASVTAVSAMCYPFAWQHVFIPVLPKSLLGYCTAPMPFLVGCLSEDAARLERMPVEPDIIVYDLDERVFVRAPKSFLDNAAAAEKATPANSKTASAAHDDDDDQWHLASPLLALRQQLLRVLQGRFAGRVFDCAVARALLQCQLATFGDYRPFLTAAPPRDRHLTFDDAAHSGPRPRRLRAWLELLAQTQMRESFLRERAGMMFTKTVATGQFESALSDGGASLAVDLAAQCHRCQQQQPQQQLVVRNGKLLCEACDSKPSWGRKLLDRVANRSDARSDGASTPPNISTTPPPTTQTDNNNNNLATTTTTTTSSSSSGSGIMAVLRLPSGRRSSATTQQQQQQQQSVSTRGTGDEESTNDNAQSGTMSLKRNLFKRISNARDRISATSRSNPTSPRDSPSDRSPEPAPRSRAVHTAADEANAVLTMAAEAEFLAQSIPDKERAQRIIQAAQKAKQYGGDLLEEEVRTTKKQVPNTAPPGKPRCAVCGATLRNAIDDVVVDANTAYCKTCFLKRNEQVN